MSRHTSMRAEEQAEAEFEYREAQAYKDFSREVLRRQIDWRHYQHEGKISSKECNLILGYDQQDALTQQDMLDEAGPALAGLLLKLLSTIANIDTQEYTICLIEQMLSAEKSTEQVDTATQYFLTYAAANPKVDLAAPLLQILTTSGQHNPYTFLRVQHILAVLLSAMFKEGQRQVFGDERAQRLTVVQFLRYLISKISLLSSTSYAPISQPAAYATSPYQPSSPNSSAAANNRELLACLSSLKQLLRASHRIQSLFVEQDGLRALTSLLHKETHNAQLLYLVGFNLWLLAYDQEFALKLKELGVIKRLVAVVKVNVMEKVIRISLAILRNFLDHSADGFNEDMIGHGLPSVLETLSKRKFKDPDIVSDLTRLSEVLQETIRTMSTFDKYQVEVMSGALSWNNPAHKNEIFWRENIHLFEGQNYQLVQQLVKLAEAQPPGVVGGVGEGAADREEMVREVACFDLGEFARFHPDGKRILHKLGAKSVLMKNLADKSTKISKAALLATQKLMIANWEFLNKSSSGGVASVVAQKK